MLIAVDTETTGLSVWKGDRPFMVNLYSPEFGHIIWQTYVDPYTREVKWPEKVVEEINHWLCNPFIEKVFHNAKFDIRMLESIGVYVKGKIHDTYYMAKACYTLEPKYGLKPLAKKYLNMDDSDETSLKKRVQSARLKVKKQGAMIADELEADYWLDDATEYCQKDCERCYNLCKFYIEGMEMLNVKSAYEKEMQLFPYIYEMEARGMRYDVQKAKELITDGKKKSLALEVKIVEDSEFTIANVNSGPQIRAYLASKNLLSTQLTQETKLASTSSEALQELEWHPFVSTLLEYRSISKAVDYLENYNNFIVGDSLISVEDILSPQYCIHCNLDSWGAGTNRFSCRNPNLQNVGDPATSGKKIPINLRSVFVPRTNHCWITFDYKQLELRIFASRAQEDNMIVAFREGRDIHEETRKLVLPYLEPGPGRKIAKNINFLKIYGGGAKTLSKKYGVPLDDAYRFLNDYDTEFPGIKKTLERNIRIAQNQGYIINAFGRKIFVNPDLAYTATNYDIQSSAADLMKSAIIQIGEYLRYIKKRIYMLLTIHDELIFEVHYDDLDMNTMRTIKHLFEENYGRFCIPTPSDCKIITEHWGDKKEFQL